MVRALILAAAVFTLAAICLTQNIEENMIEEVISGGNGDISEAKIGIPTGEIISALNEQMSQDSGRAAGFFNLSAYLSSNPNPNNTQLTFVPLITLLIAALQG